ncbi:kinase-like protein [Rhizopogon salebrosus TDB-379]|nr:kinase-like protein [Rhizopogon salebrosus TDB-379]
MQRIRRQLKGWLKLKRPTIVPLLGIAYVEGPFPALVSQWMSFGTLYTYLQTRPTITTVARVVLAKGVADGLNYLHSENVVHGDLHPGNVFMDGLGNPCLANFGLATVIEHPKLEELSPDSRWRAPEVVGVEHDPEKPTFKSDIYSFGGVMFLIVSGDIPCIELSRRLTPARPDNVLDKHWYLITKCWSWDPGDRPSSAEVLKHVISKGTVARNGTRDTPQVRDL